MVIVGSMLSLVRLIVVKRMGWRILRLNDVDSSRVEPGRIVRIDDERPQACSDYSTHPNKIRGRA